MSPSTIGFIMGIMLGGFLGVVMMLCIAALCQKNPPECNISWPEYTHSNPEQSRR